ncbi:MAG: hypothetical protein RMX68_025000 [Aulosira sp. ZfuVER01]|nr:hypothetical protein [Aulosira sp. ZfuVER01]MDZ7997978.1 hypothetical protein [Aulosira sp. DedVER01a]MDZ8054631.1 hypothetical protein [Aulosira sp. ZfuCHP01]
MKNNTKVLTTNFSSELFASGEHPMSVDPNSQKISEQTVQPLTPLAISLSGVNTCQLAIPVPPTLDSAEQAAEFLEIAWQLVFSEMKS